MRKLALVGLLAISTVAVAQKAADKGKPVTIKVPPLPPSTTDLLFADPAHAAWTPVEKLGYAPGAQAALIGQDPVSTGPTMYFKAPGGYKIALHWHTHSEHIYFISGKATLTAEGKPHVLEPGSYLSMPSKTQHSFECAAGAECLFVVERSGPADVNWVKASK
jgi:quercetin dioxygenase-like cupin family protein